MGRRTRTRVVHRRPAEHAVRQLRDPRGLSSRGRARQKARGALGGPAGRGSDGTALLDRSRLITRRGKSSRVTQENADATRQAPARLHGYYRKDEYVAAEQTEHRLLPRNL